MHNTNRQKSLYITLLRRKSVNICIITTINSIYIVQTFQKCQRMQVRFPKNSVFLKNTRRIRHQNKEYAQLRFQHDQTSP